ncbi:zinc finger CCCH domain-containing protein 32-like isoform X1 [Salvia splendens]|uniref:zinc finger CCCH domain-containing protein 32-like isoform X1 n=2 Tax=Salvia splendens TaxID=180675 RepID=UPI001C27AB56|nr:zinc finger CCCH domain-containing protein 32-like isoform X1 [Salvia splendens]
MKLYGDQQQVEWAQDSGLEDSMRGLNLWERQVYPERPGQPDCAYYVRTGSCGYAAKCRYNHPRDRSSSLGVGEYPERLGEPPCQYYLRTGICKFGMSCKFNHPKNAGGSLTSAPLNSYGYPLRPGEQECSYYLKTGQCKFGITCKFDHPQSDGTSVSASARPFYPTMQSLSSRTPEQYDSATSSYRVARPSLLPGSYVSGAYGHMLLPGVVPIPNWNPHSGSVSPAPSPGAQASAGATSVYGLSQLGSSPPAFVGAYSHLPSSAGPSGSIVQEQKFPERPGQPDCKYYMRTGDCKYGPSCRYNHPSCRYNHTPDWAVSKSNCALSPLGLPLRPGVQACSFYMQKGQCKFGRTCKYDHPIATLKYSPASSYTEMPGTRYGPGLSAATTLLPSYSFQEMQGEHIAGSSVDPGINRVWHSGNSSSDSANLML